MRSWIKPRVYGIPGNRWRTLGNHWAASPSLETSCRATPTRPSDDVQRDSVCPDHRLYLEWRPSALRHEIDGTSVSPLPCRTRHLSGHFSRPSPIGVWDPENRSHPLFHWYQGYPGQKGGSTGYDGYKKVKGNKLSALVDRSGLPLACTVFPANIHDSQLYEPTVEAFTIPEMQVHPSIISADAAYDAQKIRQYNRKRGIKSNIPTNPRSRVHPKRGRPRWFDPILYKERGAIERLFSLIINWSTFPQNAHHKLIHPIPPPAPFLDLEGPSRWNRWAISNAL